MVQLLPCVLLRCVRVGSKLRVRIVTPNYNSSANCRFPRSIRADGRFYQVPATDVHFGPERLSFHYIIATPRHSITILSETAAAAIARQMEGESARIKSDNVYEDVDATDCHICMNNPKTTVFVPCGHYYCCRECSDAIVQKSAKCPMCRRPIQQLVDSEALANA